MRRKRGKRALCGHKKPCRQACVGGCPFAQNEGDHACCHINTPPGLRAERTAYQRRQREVPLSRGIKRSTP